MFFINCTLRESSMLHGIYFILVESMPGEHRKAFVFNFDRTVWMNTFCHTVCCMWHISAVEQTMLRESLHSHRIYDTCHIYHIYVFGEGSRFRPTSARCDVTC